MTSAYSLSVKAPIYFSLDYWNSNTIVYPLFFQKNIGIFHKLSAKVYVMVLRTFTDKTFLSIRIKWGEIGKSNKLVPKNFYKMKNGVVFCCMIR